MPFPKRFHLQNIYKNILQKLLKKQPLEYLV